jgi:chromosome partitioning protein
LEVALNILTLASRKGGSGKSTLAAHLAAHVHKASQRCLLVDCDPQGSLSVWHNLRGTGEPELKIAARGVDHIVAAAKRDGIDWVFIDTPPNMSMVVTDAIQAATLVVIPARPSILDLEAVKDTIAVARQFRKPYAVVINGAPARRDDVESPLVAFAREKLVSYRVPVWGGQITNRADYILAVGAGEGVREYDADSRAAGEIGRLWSAIAKSVKAIRGDGEASGAMHRRAA